MRILVISDHYPPLQLGGYEIACRDVTDMMSARRHVTHVLTSVHGKAWIPPDRGVTRLLPIRSERLLPLFWQEVRAYAIARRAIQAFRPNVISVWNAGHLPWSTVVAAEESGVPTTYYLQDHWLLYTRSVGWQGVWSAPTEDRRIQAIRLVGRRTGLTRLVHTVAPCAPIVPDATRLAFVSGSLRDEHARDGFDVASSRIIPNGIDPSEIP